MRIAVVGGGIAGLASALALAAQGRGHEITVLERRTGFGEAGAGIQLSPNATRVLFGLGLETALRRFGSEPDGIVIRAVGSGRKIGEVALGRPMRERFGAPYLAIARSDLHAALLDAVRGRAEIRLRVGRTAAACEADAGCARLRFETAAGSSEDLAADFVVGADGLWSTTRRWVGDTRRPAYRGYAAFRAVLEADRVPETLRGTSGLWLGPGRHVVHYPVAAGRLLNVVVVLRRPEPLEGWSAAAARKEVVAGLDGGAALLRDLAALPSAWAGWSLFDLPARTLAHGRLALIGDAAHPVLPYLAQGGSLAIEDAAHLAARLGPDPAGVPGALRLYARERLGRVRRVQDAARRNGRIYHAGAWIGAARDLAMRRLGPTGMSERFSWIYGWTPPGPA